MARVLLLNPPARGRLKLRDFACGESTKADYYWAPIDLLVLSGLLAGHHDVEVLDAVVGGLSAEQASRRARAARPDVVFALTSAVTLAEDETFLRRLAADTGARVYGLGDVASYAPVETLAEAPSFDGMIRNFGDPSLLRLVDGRTTGLHGVVLRRPDGPRVFPVTLRDPLRYPLPRHELFPWRRYRLPFSDWRGSTSVITATGCPYPCTFCASGGLPPQARRIADVVEELRYVRGLGIDEFYLRDFTFGPTRPRALALARAIAEADLGFRWSAECRIDVVDEEILRWMARAGCEVILVGIESGAREVLLRLGKRHTADRSERVLRAAREQGIRTCGHFVLGCPDETAAQVAETIRLARTLPLDYASFNLYAPRLGSRLRAALVDAGQIAADDLGNPDVSLRADSFAAVDSAALERLFRRAVLSFYFRPAQILRLLGNTPWSTLARQGAGVLRLLFETEH